MRITAILSISSLDSIENNIQLLDSNVSVWHRQAVDWKVIANKP